MDAPTQSSTRRIFQAAAVISLATFAIRLAGLAKSQVVAARFGVADAVEAYFLAAILPTFAFGALGAALPSALVPVVVRVRVRGEEALVRALLRDIYAWSVAILLGVSALLALVWPLFLASAGGGFTAEKAALSTELFRVLLPIVFLHGLATVFGAVLKADKSFLAATLGSGAIPVTITAVVFLLSGRYGAFALAGGQVLGVALELVLVGSALGRRGQPLLPRGLPRAGPDVRLMGAQYLPAMGGGLFFASTQLVDQSMAARLPEGSLATLSYANALITALLSIGTTALGTAILPYFSDLAAAHELWRMRASLRSTLRLVVGLAVPAAAGLALGSDLVVRLIFQHGAFGAGATAAVGAVFALYVLQLPFFTTVVVCSRTLSALHQNATVFRAAIANLVLNVVLNLVFIRWMGVRGIALATSTTHLLVGVWLWRMAEKRLSTGEG